MPKNKPHSKGHPFPEGRVTIRLGPTVSNPGDERLKLTQYHITTLMDDIEQALKGVSYPSIDTFKSVSYAVIKSYLRGRGLRANNKNFRNLFEQLLIRTVNQENTSSSHFKDWCQRILEGQPDQALTDDWQLRLRGMEMTGGQPRPIYHVGSIAKINLADIPGPLILSTESNTTTFTDISEFTAFLVDLWDTIRQIESLTSPSTETALPSSYAYRCTNEWEQMIREKLQASDETLDGSDATGL